MNPVESTDFFIFLDIAKNLSKQSARRTSTNREFGSYNVQWSSSCSTITIDAVLAAAVAAKNEPRLFYRPSGRPMVNQSFSSHYYDYPMGDGSDTTRGG